jgi:alpha-beta hydrolase superfamily lysophospholipase
MIRKSAYWLFKIFSTIVYLAIVVLTTLVLGAAWAKRSGPELQDWHRVVLESEYSRSDESEEFTFKHYLEREEALFSELADKLDYPAPADRPDYVNRYAVGSIAHPVRDDRNWNRTAEWMPEGAIRGAVLMLHGMTDSPYSMRHLAKIFRDQGFYVLNMRMPAHGTAPSELARVEWRTWMAAVRLGASHAREQATADKPFWIVGYSNGAALAIKHTLDLIEQGGTPPDQLVLLSPMIGVSGLARITRYFYWLGKLNFFEKSLWLDVLPEYDPHKYNSFPMNAPTQSLGLTRSINAQLQKLQSNGALKNMPPVLSFQSLVDSTVNTRAIGRDLYDRLPDNGSELVIFDVNRAGWLDGFVKPGANRLLEDLTSSQQYDYDITLITNRTETSSEVREINKAAGESELKEQDLPMAWPEEFYSLSHVALPFPPHDPVYGYRAVTEKHGFPRLGAVRLRGESGALDLPPSLFTRARSNPFYEYLQQRLEHLATAQ